MSDSKSSMKMPLVEDAAQYPTRELIVLHLCEAARLGGKMKEEIDIKLFNHLIGMAVYAAQEGEEGSTSPQGDRRVH